MVLDFPLCPGAGSSRQAGEYRGLDRSIPNAEVRLLNKTPGKAQKSDQNEP